MKKNVYIILSIVALLSAGVIVSQSFGDSINTSRGNKKGVPAAASSGLTTIAENLVTPWSIVFYGETALVSSRDTGEVLEINKDTGTMRVIGKVSDAMRRGEGGLLGLALDKQQRLYAYYTTKSDNRISRFALIGQPGNLKLGNPEVIIEGLPSASFHNGGRIAFGPDGALYATVGDAGDTVSAQDLKKLSGKILRMTQDGAVPSDNPYPNSLVYSYGHRNPQGMAWSKNGSMYASEFGQNTWDELNVIKAGANYGWPTVEGIEGREGFVDPVQQWATDEASPSGMAYANGMLYIANLRGQVLRIIPVDDLGTSTLRYKDELGRLRDVTTAADGSVWFITNNTDGRGEPAENDDRILRINK